jgi:hypothetical protein
VLDWIGKEINLIDTLKVVDGWKLTNRQLREINLKKYKFVVYIDATCFTCAEDLISWSKIIKDIEQDKFDYLFYLHTNELEVLEPYIKRWGFYLPFIIDTENTFFYENKINIEKLFQAMLIDENNKVLLIGNPVYSEDMLTLYKKAIASLE